MYYIHNLYDWHLQYAPASHEIYQGRSTHKAHNSFRIRAEYTMMDNICIIYMDGYAAFSSSQMWFRSSSILCWICFWWLCLAYIWGLRLSLFMWRENRLRTRGRRGFLLLYMRKYISINMNGFDPNESYSFIMILFWGKGKMRVCRSSGLCSVALNLCCCYHDIFVINCIVICKHWLWLRVKFDETFLNEYCIRDSI